MPNPTHLRLAAAALPLTLLKWMQPVCNRDIAAVASSSGGFPGADLPSAQGYGIVHAGMYPDDWHVRYPHYAETLKSFGNVMCVDGCFTVHSSGARSANTQDCQVLAGL